MSEFDNVTAPPPPTAGEAPQDQRTMSLLAHLLKLRANHFVGIVKNVFIDEIRF